MNKYRFFAPKRRSEADGLEELKKQVEALRSEILKTISAITKSSDDGVIEKSGHSYLTTDENRNKCSVIRLETAEDSVVAVLEYSHALGERSVPLAALNVEDLLEIMIEILK